MASFSLLNITLLNDTYYISTAPTGTYLQFNANDIGANVTALAYTGLPEQQWHVTGDSSTYSVQNVFSGTYIAHAQQNTTGVEYLFSSRSPFNWFVGASQGGFVFSYSPSFDKMWDMTGGVTKDNQSIIHYTSPSVFLLKSTSSSRMLTKKSANPSSPSGFLALSSRSNISAPSNSSSFPSPTSFPSPSGSPDSTGADLNGSSSHLSPGAEAGIAIGAALVVILIVGGAILAYRKWWRQPRTDNGPAESQLPGWTDPPPTSDASKVEK